MVDRIADIRRQLQARLDVVLVNVPAFDAASGHLPLRALDLRLAELTALFTMRTFGLQLGDIQFAANHDAALASGARDFCLIQKIGHIFHGPADDVASALLAELDACPFLTGHIMERGGYYYLHDQCVLVNRRAWQELGRPAFGTPTAGPQRAAVPRRSAENVHDDYTPVFLEPTGEERDWQGAFGYGWQAISESLRRGMPVLNWRESRAALEAQLLCLLWRSGGMAARARRRHGNCADCRRWFARHWRLSQRGVRRRRFTYSSLWRRSRRRHSAPSCAQRY